MYCIPKNQNVFTQKKNCIAFTLFLISSIFLILKMDSVLAVPIVNLDLKMANSMNVNTPNSDDLVEKLVNGFYGDIFNFAIYEAVVDRIWREPNIRERLMNIVRDENAPMKARFLACEVLYKRSLGFSRDVEFNSLVNIYIHALKNNYTGSANLWGLLYEKKDLGFLGGRFTGKGDRIIPLLIPLLDDDSPMSPYRGSRDATLGNSYRYRIKDVFAYYLSRTTGIPVEFHQDFADRDAEIEKLKVALADYLKSAQEQ